MTAYAQDTDTVPASRYAHTAGWASPWASHPAITGHARQERGPVQDTDRSHVIDIKSNLPSTKLLRTCDIVSHRLAAEGAGRAQISASELYSLRWG
jgi:hypothetical protein